MYMYTPYITIKNYGRWMILLIAKTKKKWAEFQRKRKNRGSDGPPSWGISDHVVRLVSWVKEED